MAIAYPLAAQSTDAAHDQDVDHGNGDYTHVFQEKHHGKISRLPAAFPDIQYADQMCYGERYNKDNQQVHQSIE